MVLRPLFSALSPLWACVNCAARPLLSRHRTEFEVPVISVGNILAGGVGKTEVAASVAQHFLARGKRVTVALRGAGSPSWQKKGGVASDFAAALEQRFPDEALVHLLKAPGVSVAVGAQRREVLRKYWNELKPDLVILDDGLQHFKINRDLDLVVHDFSVPWPVYRDFPSLMARPDLVRVALSEVPASWQHLPWVRGRYAIKGVRDADHSTLEPLPAAVRAFCGLGNPDRFEASLARAGARVAAFKRFPDHMVYDASVLRQLEVWRKTTGDEVTVTTLKDYVKLVPLQEKLGFPLRYIELELQWEENETLLWSQLDEIMAVSRA